MTSHALVMAGEPRGTLEWHFYLMMFMIGAVIVIQYGVEIINPPSGRSEYIFRFMLAVMTMICTIRYVAIGLWFRPRPKLWMVALIWLCLSALNICLYGYWAIYPMEYPWHNL